MSPDLLILSSIHLELELSPCIGGSISRLSYLAAGEPRSILRECHTPLENVLDAASFPLVPFVNRVRDGSFSFRDRSVSLAPNMAGDPSPLHGQGWLNPWQVDSASGSEAVLSYRHEPGEWPWAYEAQQHFHVEAGVLSVGLTCRNISDDAMPCGLGQHPYFPCGAKTRIETKVTHVWTIDEHVLPVDKVPASGRYDLSDRLICGQDLDHGFGGWSGRALIDDPDWPYELELSSPEARFFQIYSPKSGDFFVAEPVSHANAAMNAPEPDWPELGLRVLEPGEEMRLDMRLEARSK
jgi:aldose 1-epimerase